MNYFCFSQQIGSFFLSPAHGWRGARATIQNVSAPPSAEKIRVVQQAGKKEGGLGEGIFARLLCRAKRGMGWEAAPHTSPVKRSKAKHFSLFSILARERCERVPSSENSQCLTWSGCWELNPVYAHPKRVSCRQTPPRNPSCAPDRIRTCDLRVRSALLYPTELLEHPPYFTNICLKSLFFA